MITNEMKLYYYGTSLTEYGHYYWEIGEYGMYKNYDLGDGLPFYPYEMVPQTSIPQKGVTQYQQIGGYSILGMEGSCLDQRGGTVSVFFIKGDASEEQLVEMIATNPMTKKMLEQMPFQSSLAIPKQ